MLKVAAECHLHGLVHRDMKPEVDSKFYFAKHGLFNYNMSNSLQNFLFKSTKEDSPLKATDFGLSDFIKPGII